MPAVLVNGVPDTARLWDPVREHLERDDVITAAPPGFGAPVPDGFGATKEEYAAWLVATLEEIGEPVDLVGHDWGCIHAQRVASTRPDLVRTLACGSGPVDKDYVWHPMAQLWQSGQGDDVVAAMCAMPKPDLAVGFVAGGAPAELAEIQAAAVDEAMGRCILDLYRSAVTVGAEWEDAVAAMPPRPALVLWGADDPYVTTDVGARLAARLDAELVVFEGCAHWWPWERPRETAEALERLWSS